MKFYIAGKITDNQNYKQQFEAAQSFLERAGHIVMNPAILPPGFEHHEYMKICYAMIDVCDAVYFLENWQDSKGAKLEMDYLIRINIYGTKPRKQIFFQIEGVEMKQRAKNK